MTKKLDIEQLKEAGDKLVRANKKVKTSSEEILEICKKIRKNKDERR